ncbi:ferredoxin [Patescibacteria group bacterium]|nr:ferredoxin [Patescibacteria group bacterium]MBU1890189.1 ferredoxin [Patescibacteria group bacterium]
MKINIDKEKCTGCGTCVALYPQVFTLDSDGKSKVVDQKSCETGECDCQVAVDSCPSQAISLKK